MSFIYDDRKLIEKLLEAGEQSTVKTAQQAQQQSQVPEADIQKAYQEYTAKNPQQPRSDYNTFKTWYLQNQAYQQTLAHPTISPEAVSAYKLAKKLLLGLRATVITDPNDPEFVKKSAPVDFDAEQAPDIKPENLETLGDFLTWAAVNKVKWDGKRIAWDYTPADPDANPPTPESGEKPDDPNAWVFQSYQKGRDRDQFTRQAVTKTYYANKDGLIRFLTYLRDTPTAKDNKVFEVMIGKVISQANQYLQPNEQIGPRPNATPVAQFNDSDIVDGFASSVMDVKDPYAGLEGNAPTFQNSPQRLTYGDIKDLGSLQGWLGGMTGPDKKNPMSPDGNPCPLIHILYLRAKYLASQVRYDKLRPKYSDLAKIYLQNITNFGKQFTYNGQACAVTQPGTATPEQPGQQPGQKGQQGSGINPQALQQLAALRPFKTQQIDFREIKLFLDRYMALANKPGITAMVGQIKQSMDGADQLMGTTDVPIQIDNLTTAKVKNMTNQPIPLMNLLYTVISYSGRVYQDFYNEFKTILGDDAARPVEQQITSGGPQQTNLGTLLRVKELLMQEVQRGR